MQIIEQNSICHISCDFCLSTLDEQVLSFLYLPIFKSTSYALYSALYHFSSLNAPLGGFLQTDFAQMLGMETSEFLMARLRLEGIGLLETFRKEESDRSSQLKVTYWYKLLPPASPKKFFDDVLLRSLLSTAVGNKRYFFLSHYFKCQDNVSLDDFTEISSSFKDIYTLQVGEDDVALKPLDFSMPEKQYKSQSSFQREELKKALQKEQIPFSAIKDSIKEIENFCALYSPSLKDTVDLIVKNTDSDGIFYLESFGRDIRSLKKYSVTPKNKTSAPVTMSDSAIAQVIQNYDRLNPEDFLSIIYKAKPASFMLNEIENLKTVFGYSNGIINAILDYSRKKTNNEFNVNFIEKVAYTLSSLDVKDTYDAMVKLNSRDFELSQNVKRRNKKTNPKKHEQENDSLSLDELDSLSKEFGL